MMHVPGLFARGFSRRAVLMVATLLFASVSAMAQVDLSGEWAAAIHEDYTERIPGPDVGDYLGLPINDALRLRAESWDASIQTLPERQCIPHPSTYSYRGPATLRISKETDPVTQDVVSYTVYGTFGRATRVIWMDGRPHPNELAPHTWAGFSTGKWEGAILTVETTHLKAGYIRRNGVVHSDLTTMTEHYIRHGDRLTIMTIDRDPVYFTEPFIRTTDFIVNLNQQVGATPCDVTVETVRPKGSIPHHLPGKNPFLVEFTERAGVPMMAARGGAETSYPEFMARLKNPAGATPAATYAKSLGQAPTGSDAVTILPVRANLFLVSAGARNIAMSLGGDGLLLVDTGTAALAEKVAAEIQKFTAKPIRYIMNTNADEDHTGGNTFLSGIGKRIGGAGAGAFGFADVARADQRAEIFAHEKVLARMSAPTGRQSPTPTTAWPTTTYFVDSKELYFNDEPVQMLYQPAAHSDGDSLVFFRHSDVVVTGDLFDITGYPRIDVARGGSIQGFLDSLNKILEITIPAPQQEGGTMVIPGHGRICDEADVVEYRDMVTIIRDRILDMKKRGMTLDQIQAARPTRDYDGRFGATAGPWTTERFVEAVFQTLPR